MIEINGTAYPLMPGSTYLLIVDVNRVDPLAVEYAFSDANNQGIHLVYFPVNGNVNAVRVVNIEKPESPNASRT